MLPVLEQKLYNERCKGYGEGLERAVAELTEIHDRVMAGDFGDEEIAELDEDTVAWLVNRISNI